MQSLSLDLIALDILPLALFRDLYAARPENPVAILDIGSRQATLSVFGTTGLVYAHTSYIAGDRFTEAIAANGSANAKEDKKKYGLDQPDPAARAALEREAGALLQEVKKAIAFFEKRRGVHVAELLLAGGGSQMAGLHAYAEKQMEIPVRLGESVLLKDPRYIGAVGMALRGIDRRWKNDPVIPIRAKKLRKKLMLAGRKPALYWEISALAAILLIGAGLLFLIFRERQKDSAERHLEQQERAMEQLNAIEEGAVGNSL
jgi:cell division ATPase FtsA